ncbi:hypothetical protein L1887_11376 [Cichorium endivia]|nr:hypothetical protein L1887_11376 [Cichorium endivia]
MGLSHSMGDEWTEVRRWRQKGHRSNGDDTTFYVTNFPRRTSIHDLRKVCESVGNVVCSSLEIWRRKINEELTVNLDDKQFRIVVSETEDEWYSFKPFSTYCQCESDHDDAVEEEAEEDEDGFSDTCD